MWFMGLENTERVRQLKKRLAECKPDEVELFFKFVDRHLEKDRKDNQWIEGHVTELEFWSEELDLDKIEKLIVYLKS